MKISNRSSRHIKCIISAGQFLVEALRPGYSGEGPGPETGEFLPPPGHSPGQVARGEQERAGLAGPDPAGAQAGGSGDSLSGIADQKPANQLLS